MVDTSLMSSTVEQISGFQSSITSKDEKEDVPKFTTPEHPSVTYLKLLKGSWDSSNDDPPSYQPRDPHEIPSYTNASFLQPSFPVLYLPPLISSLPDSLPPLPVPKQHPPMVTETRLPDIDPVSLSLHKALHYFRPLNDKYATSPYAEAFNWSELRLPLHEEREWYCVAFRSKRKEGSDGTRMFF